MSSVAHGNYSGQRLVVFGCGYVGAAVAERALAAGLHVVALTRNTATAAALRAGGIETVVADIASDLWYPNVPSCPEYVLNCLSGGGSGAAGYHHTYVQGMESILRWAATHGTVGTLVYTSSTSVYPVGGGVVVDETAATAEVGVERAGILVDAERRLADSPVGCGRWFTLRLAGIYGPGRHHLLEQVKAGVVSGVGDHHLNLIHRDDVAAAIWACFTAPATIRNQIYNVADDGHATKAEVVQWLSDRLGHCTPSFSGMPVGSRRVTPDRIIANGKLKAALGWRPAFPTFREGYAALLS